MSKELVGQVQPFIPSLPPVLPEPEDVPPSKAFLADLKGDKGDPGVVDPEAVNGMVADYLEANPPGVNAASFIQSTPATEWVIIHTLPFNPSVTIIDSAGTRIETEIVYDSPTQIRSISTAAFSGRAELS